MQRALLPQALPELSSIALTVLLPFCFALVHGSVAYRFRDMLAFLVICLVVSNAMENSSILTGFPFGHYYYTAALGPKLFFVPQLIGPAYMATGYVSWMLARISLRDAHGRRFGPHEFTVPLLASFIMVSWDLSIDPVASTIGHKWIWVNGGNYFGVPFSNFMGWFLTVYLFFQLFALYLRSRGTERDARPAMPNGYWLQALIVYTITALPPVLNIVTQHSGATIVDPAGGAWRVRDIYVATGLCCIFTMGAFIALAAGILVDGLRYDHRAAGINKLS